MTSKSLPGQEEMVNYRARKSGIALKIQKKLEERYDEEEGLGTPARVIEWINVVLEGEHPVCHGSSWQKLQFHMRDGVALCKLLNKVRVAAGMSPVKYKENASTPFVALANIEIFTGGAGEYGVPPEALFQSGDLYEGLKGPLLNVMNCINKLGFVANTKGFTPRFESVEAERRDSERWAST